MPNRFAHSRGLFLLLAVAAAFTLAGCGGSSSKSFMLQVAPATVSITPGGAPQVLTVSATPVNGFSTAVSVTLSSLPTGVTASPSTLSLTPGALGQITLTASASATPGNTTLTLTGTAGSLTQNAMSVLSVAMPPPTTIATLSTTFFDFGGNLVNNTVTQTVVAVTNTGSRALTMSPALTGDASYSIVSAQSCGTSLAAGASCNTVVSYDPTTASAPNTQNAVLNMGFGGVSSSTPETVSITGESGTLTAAQVTTTDNPQVALYTMTLPFPGSMTVNFGTTTSYGQTTWARSTDTAGGQVSIFVAGMKASTTYHMAATVQFANGVTATDSDHSFTTGPVPTTLRPTLTTTTTAGMTPQPGLELLNTLGTVDITDLAGNILWAYVQPGTEATNIVDGVKMLPDENILMTIGPDSQNMLTGPPAANAFVEIREVNLGGDTVREISIND